jgi:hypothetical protein
MNFYKQNKISSKKCQDRMLLISFLTSSKRHEFHGKHHQCWNPKTSNHEWKTISHYVFELFSFLFCRGMFSFELIRMNILRFPLLLFFLYCALFYLWLFAIVRYCVVSVLLLNNIRIFKKKKEHNMRYSTPLQTQLSMYLLLHFCIAP